MKKSRMVMTFDLYGTLMTNHSKHILILFIYNARKHKFSKVLIVNAAKLVRLVMHISNQMIELLSWDTVIMNLAQ